MKKTLMMLAIAACAVQAQAAKTRYLWYQQAYDASTGKSREFTADDAGAVGYYSFYTLSASDAERVTEMKLPYSNKTDPAAKDSVAKLVNWLNVDANREAWMTDTAVVTWDDGLTFDGETDKAIKMTEKDADNNDSIRWTVAFYDDGKKEAFAVTLTGFLLDGTPTNWDYKEGRGSEQLRTSESYHGTTAWHTIPEPTSGLLMLLGLAGLALKRKRA